MTADRAERGPAPVTLQIVLLSLGTFIVGTNGFIIAGLLPDIAESLAVTPSGVGISITVYAAVVAALAPTFATVLARVPRTRLIAAGLVVTAIGTALTALAADLPVFILGRAVAGIGGAAIVPTAVAAAAVMVPVTRRGWAIAIVMIGFTFATALGSPIGTAIAHVGGWQVPLAGVAVLSAAAAPVVAFVVRESPPGPPLSLVRRFSVLGEPRILFALLSTVFTIAGFNTAYIFSSTFTVDATGGSGALLAVLLLIYGVGGIGGNQVAGRLTDRFGNRIVASLLMVVHLVVLVVMPLAEPSFAALAVVFLIWGFAAFGTGIPVQHRLASVDPDRASVAVSWYPTAVYVGIALAPLIGGAALDAVGPSRVPHVAAISVLLAAVLFQVGFLVRRGRADPRAHEAA